VNINNKVGMGKSYFITVLFKTLSKLAAIANKLLPLIKITPISITTFNINSQTIYNLLKLLVQYLFKNLLPVNLTPLQHKFKNIYYLILNKKSIVRYIHLG
jgi:hypothetical protein